MPNWCMNNISITANTKEDAEFLQSLDGLEEGIFQKLMPMPDCLLDSNPSEDVDSQKSQALIEETGSPDWWSWRVDNWGTKWDANLGFVEYVPEQNSLEITADTAWSPPIGLYHYLVDQGFDVTATYYEPGLCFAGLYDNGEEHYYEDVVENYFLEGSTENLPEPLKVLNEEFDLESEAEYWKDLE